MQTSADEPCSPTGPRLKVGWPTEAGARWITEHEDDPEEESPQSNDETAEESPQSNDEIAENFAKLHDAEAEGSTGINSHGPAEDTHRQVQCGGGEASTGEVAGIHAHLTKVTSTVKDRQAPVEDEPDENDSQDAREVIAGGREQVDTSLKLIDT